MVIKKPSEKAILDAGRKNISLKRQILAHFLVFWLHEIYSGMYLEHSNVTDITIYPDY